MPNSNKPIAPAIDKSPERQSEFTTISGHPIRRLYTEADLPENYAAKQLGIPGEPPYTRGIHATMHRGRLWTMRQFAGFGVQPANRIDRKSTRLNSSHTVLS